MFPRSQPLDAENKKRKKKQQETANLNDCVDEKLVSNSDSSDSDESYGDEVDLNTSKPSIWEDLSWMDKKYISEKELQELTKKDIAHWKQVLIRIFAVVKYFAKCNFAFHGTNEKLYEESDDKFLGFLKMIAEFDPVMLYHFRMIEGKKDHHQYLSHKIQNESIELLASNLKSEIIKKIKKARYFSVILDCTHDVTLEEQHVTFIIRCVDMLSVPFKVEEYFLKFLVIEDKSSKALFDVLQDVLISLGLDIKSMRGLGYDNGINMKGKHQGMLKRFLDINPKVFYMPCDCHLNIALCDMANSCQKAKIFFGACQTIYDVFSNSTKWRNVLLEYIDDSTLKSLCVTRLESHVDSVKAIKTKLGKIRDALIKLADVCDDVKMCRDAESLINGELSSFEFILCLVIWQEILFITNMVCKLFESKDMLLHIRVRSLQGLITYFENYRESGFDSSIIDAKEIAEKNGVEIEQFEQSTQEFFKTDYFLVLVDMTLSQLRSRIEYMKHFESLFGFLCDASKLFKTKGDDLKKCCLNLEIALTHGDDVDIDGKCLYTELKFLQGMLPRKAYEEAKPWTSIQIMEFARKTNMFPYVMIVYRVLVSIPITLLSAETRFSKIKLLKSYLPSTMSQERFNELAILSTESELLENTDCDRLIEDFASRIAPIYHFR